MVMWLAQGHIDTFFTLPAQVFKLATFCLLALTARLPATTTGLLTSYTMKEEDNGKEYSELYSAVTTMISCTAFLKLLEQYCSIFLLMGERELEQKRKDCIMSQWHV